jgi:hypothetical protein
VPNEYVVELGPHDYERIEEWAEPLGAELATMVREHAAEAGYSFVGPVHVSFEQHPNIGTGVFRIRSAVAAPAGGGVIPSPPVAAAPAAPAVSRPVAAPAPPVVTPAIPPPMPTADLRGPRPAPSGALPRRPRLIVAISGDESAYFLTHPVTVIGRAVDTDLRIEYSGVSRRHAELRYVDGGVELVDLGSTNGVTVNGTPISRVTLTDGDRIDLGSTSLIFRIDED